MRSLLPAKLPGPSLRVRAFMAGFAACFASTVSLAAASEATPESTPQDGTIGYVLTDLYWAMYQTPEGEAECANGFNDQGPREQFRILFPEDEKRTVVGTQLTVEQWTWHPETAPDSLPLPWHKVTGTVARGMNLDGAIGEHDFTTPGGLQGVDNQLFRAIGCIIGFRGPDGVEFIFENRAIAADAYNRTMIELVGVDDLANDNDVQVVIYRGMDRLLTDATGREVVPGGTQRIDTEWGRRLIQLVDGKIVDHILTTEPTDEMVIPWQNLSVPSQQRIRGMRMQLELTPTGAEGMIAGYADVETWYKQLIRNDSTHHLGDGQISALSLHKALRRLADGYPDPKTGNNTAISSALDAKFKQVFIVHPEGTDAKARLLSELRKAEVAEPKVVDAEAVELDTNKAR